MSRTIGIERTILDRLRRPIVLAAGLVIAALLLGSCASADPTDPSHFIEVQVHNDLSSSVELIQCDTSCGTLHDRQTLQAGSSTTISVSNEGIKDGYVIEDLAGKRLGCIYTNYNHVKDPAPIAISSLGQCD